MAIERNSFFYNEKNIITFIRYGAIVIVLLLSFFITKIFINNTKEALKIESKIMEKNYIEHHEIMLQNLVNKFHHLIELEKEFAEQALNQKIKEQVYQAHTIATSIYESNLKKTDYSKKQTILEIKSALENIRFNENLGYFFIFSMDGKGILNAEFPEIEGEDLWNHMDIKGEFIFQGMADALKNKNESFYNWYWRKTKNDLIEYKKHGFIKKFEAYDFYIGTGQYIEVFEKRLKENVLKKINSFRFKKPEHIFIYSLNGVSLANQNKEIIGINMYNSKNKDSRYLVKELLEYVQKNKEGFVRYDTFLNTDKKISYLKIFEDWNWVIGSDFYLEMMYQKLKKREQLLIENHKKAVNQIILISCVITLIILILSFFISRVIFNIFKAYKIKVRVEMRKTLAKEKLLVQQSKMAMMGEMIGNIAHQWKQPLSLISLSNGVMRLKQEGAMDVDNTAIDKSIENIDNSVQYLSETIDDFRNFFKPDKEKKYFHFEDIYEKTYKLIDTQFKNNNIIILTDIQNFQLYGYENEFLQVLINLIKNAKDELIKIDTKQKKILFIKTYTKDKLSIIQVKDNAGGIKSEIIDKIFEPYFTTKKNDEGTGIGLYMSRQLVEGMDGKIEVSNEKFKYEDVEYSGAVFTIILPLKGKENE